MQHVVKYCIMVSALDAVLGAEGMSLQAVYDFCFACNMISNPKIWWSMKECQNSEGLITHEFIYIKSVTSGESVMETYYT